MLFVFGINSITTETDPICLSAWIQSWIEMQCYIKNPTVEWMLTPQSCTLYLPGNRFLYEALYFRKPLFFSPFSQAVLCKEKFLCLFSG